MIINSDELASLELTALQGNPIDLSSSIISAETGAAFNELLEQIQNAPEGTMVEIPNEWADAGRYEDFMKKEYAAYGAPRSIEELNAAGVTGKPSPETPIIPAGNGEPPVGI